MSEVNGDVTTYRHPVHGTPTGTTRCASASRRATTSAAKTRSARSSASHATACARSTPDGDYVFPNLRSGPGLLDVEVIDNETAGVVTLESGGSTLLIKDKLTTAADETETDDYTLRLTQRPTADCERRDPHRRPGRRDEHQRRAGRRCQEIGGYQAVAAVHWQHRVRERRRQGHAHARHRRRPRQLRRRRLRRRPVHPHRRRRGGVRRRLLHRRRRPTTSSRSPSPCRAPASAVEVLDTVVISRPRAARALAKVPCSSTSTLRQITRPGLTGHRTAGLARRRLPRRPARAHHRRCQPGGVRRPQDRAHPRRQRRQGREARVHRPTTR